MSDLTTEAPPWSIHDVLDRMAHLNVIVKDDTLSYLIERGYESLSALPVLSGSLRPSDFVPGEGHDTAVLGWQPIETVPERTDVLVCVTHNLGPDEWETLQWVDNVDHQGRWITYLRLMELPFPPTHWMPLPAAPEAGK